ncbi:hypothetical protein C5614_18760 [Massilia phosphatilytica]|nr:hypothetical protein C5614_18760 [Massilia phosphatilytica]
MALTVSGVAPVSALLDAPDAFVKPTETVGAAGVVVPPPVPVPPVPVPPEPVPPLTAPGLPPPPPHAVSTMAISRPVTRTPWRAVDSNLKSFMCLCLVDYSVNARSAGVRPRSSA